MLNLNSLDTEYPWDHAENKDNKEKIQVKGTGIILPHSKKKNHYPKEQMHFI